MNKARLIVGSLSILAALTLMIVALNVDFLNRNYGAWNTITLFIAAGLFIISGTWDILKDVCWYYEPILIVGIVASGINFLFTIIMFIISIFVGGISLAVVCATIISLLLNYSSGFLIFSKF